MSLLQDTCTLGTYFINMEIIIGLMKNQIELGLHLHPIIMASYKVHIFTANQKELSHIAPPLHGLSEVGACLLRKD